MRCINHIPVRRDARFASAAVASQKLERVGVLHWGGAFVSLVAAMRAGVDQAPIFVFGRAHRAISLSPETISTKGFRLLLSGGFLIVAARFLFRSGSVHGASRWSACRMSLLSGVMA